MLPSFPQLPQRPSHSIGERFDIEIHQLFATLYIFIRFVPNYSEKTLTSFRDYTVFNFRRNLDNFEATMERVRRYITYFTETMKNLSQYLTKS